MIIKINDKESIVLENVIGITLLDDARFPDQDIFEKHNDKTNTVELDCGFAYEFYMVDGTKWQSIVFETNREANAFMETILIKHCGLNENI